MLKRLDTIKSQVQSLLLTVLMPALVAMAGCGNPAGPVAGTPDAAEADTEIAESADAASPDAHVADVDPGADVPILELDCSAPQTKGCPCTVGEPSCCITQSYGLECMNWHGPAAWSTFADCCRGSDPGCNYPTPQPGWCNGKAP